MNSQTCKTPIKTSFSKDYYTPKNNINIHNKNAFTQRISASLQQFSYESYNQQYELEEKNKHSDKRNYFKLIESPPKKFQDINIGPWQQNELMSTHNELRAKSRSLKKSSFIQKNINENDNLSIFKKRKLHNQQNIAKQRHKFLNTIVYNYTLIKNENKVLQKLKLKNYNAEKLKKNYPNPNHIQNEEAFCKSKLNYLEHIKQIVNSNQKKKNLREKREEKISELMNEAPKITNSHQIVYPNSPFSHIKIQIEKKDKAVKLKYQPQKRFKSLQN